MHYDGHDVQAKSVERSTRISEVFEIATLNGGTVVRLSEIIFVAH